jgi:hypothetical protein
MVTQGMAASQQNKYLRSQGAAGDENYKATVEAVQRDIGLQTDALAAQQIETIAAQKQQLQNITLDARAASSAYTASQAETGVEGRTVQMVHDQFEREVLNFSSAAQRNLTNYTIQLNREASAIYARGQSIINSGYPAPLPPYQSINFIGSVLNGVTAGLSAGMSAQAAGIGAPKVGGSPGGTAPAVPNPSSQMYPPGSLGSYMQMGRYGAGAYFGQLG